MTHNETLTDDELRQLWTIKKHYDARLPEDVRKVYIPEKLASEASQRWLVENLIQSEATFLRAYEEEVPRGFSLGAVLWRKAFWKRIISHLEGEIAASPGEEDEIDEKILFCLSDLMSIPAGATDGTFLRRFHYTINDEVDAIVTCEDEASISGGTTGLRSWPAALHLANHLISQPHLVAGKHVLELGSGAGLIGALVHKLQRATSGSIITTDFHDAVLERLEENVKYNLTSQDDAHKARVRVARLDWSRPEDLDAKAELNLIIASDVVYDPDLAPPLASCLAYLLGKSKKASALLSQTIRNEDTWRKFESACASDQLSVEEIVLTTEPDAIRCMVTGKKPEDVIKLFRIVLRREHFATQ